MNRNMKLSETRYKRILLTLALALHLSVAYAQMLTLEQCQEKAASHYPALAQYALIDKSKEFNISNAARGWIPQIAISGQATWQNEVASFPEALKQMMAAASGVDMPGLKKDQYKLALDISQVIWDGGASRAGRLVAESEANEMRISNSVDMYALNDRVSDIFFGLLLLDANYETALSGMQTLDSNFRKLESLVRNGVALQSDLDLLEVEKITLNQSIDQNRATFECYRTMLELFIGEEIGDRALAKPADRPIPELTSDRPELKLLDAKLSTLDAREKQLKVALSPKIVAFAQGFYGYPGFDMFGSMMNNNWRWNMIAGVKLKWDINLLFTYKADRNKLDNARRMIGVQKNILQFNTGLQTTRQVAEVSRMHKALEGDEQVAALRSSIRKTAESQFEKGVIDADALLQRINEERAALSKLHTHEIELLQMEYKLKHTINR